MDKDLVILVPDKNIESTVKTLLQRPELLGIPRIQFDILVHPQRDPGCRLRAHQLLRSQARRYRYALVIFDRVGSGGESLSASQLEEKVRLELERNGWPGRAEVVVLDPELEIWVWGTSPLLEETIGWHLDLSLREWLIQKGLWKSNHPKPEAPKEALEETLFHLKVSRSSSLYVKLAEQVDRTVLERCTDRSFQRFREILWGWFAS